VSVYGKGHHASNKIPREVPTLHTDTPSLLAEYLERTRPLLLKKTEVKAFFLSSRGTRLSAEEFRSRFRSYWQAIGLGDERYTPHSLRHGSVTHQLAMRRPLVFVSKFHGHLHTSTTDRYAHFASEYTREQVKRIVDAQLKRLDKPGRKQDE
jgi:site-specific recombinase XerD